MTAISRHKNQELGIMAERPLKIDARGSNIVRDTCLVCFLLFLKRKLIPVLFVDRENQLFFHILNRFKFCCVQRGMCIYHFNTDNGKILAEKTTDIANLLKT